MTNNIDEVILPTFRKPTDVPKGWGKEIHFANFPEYCGKLLVFTKGKKLSSHFHLRKKESFIVLQGSFNFKYYDLTNATPLERLVKFMDVIDIPRGCVHQLEALEDNSIIIEVSSQDFPFDSYRVGKGDSQQEIASG